MNVNTKTSVHLHGDLDPTEIDCSFFSNFTAIDIGPVSFFLSDSMQPEQFVAALSLAVANARVKVTAASAA